MLRIKEDELMKLKFTEKEMREEFNMFKENEKKRMVREAILNVALAEVPGQFCQMIKLGYLDENDFVDAKGKLKKKGHGLIQFVDNREEEEEKAVLCGWM